MRTIFQGMLVGRETELEVMRGLLGDAREGRARVLCVHGPAGIGKTTLLRAVAEEARGAQVLRARGVESEAHLAFAGLAELLAPVLDLRAGLPDAQARALGAALAIEDGPVASTFAVAAGVLGVLAAAAESAPVVVVADDLQWIDEASRTVLLFAARRLDADAVTVLLGVRDGEGLDPEELDVPLLALEGLPSDAARALLAEEHGGLGAGLAERLVAESGGNPLALVEIPRLLDEEQRSGKVPLLGPLPLSRELSRAYGRRIGELGPAARRALLLAACAEPGEASAALPALLSGAEDRAALVEAERDGLLVLGAGRIELRHPLVRSAVLESAPAEERRAAHIALAAAGPEGSDRGAWHRAAATVGTDDAVAEELAASGRSAAARGAFADAAAALARAAELVADPDDRARLLLEAAGSAIVGGRVSWGMDLVARGEAVARDPLVAADLRATRARAASRAGRPVEGADELVAEADRLEGEPARAAAFLLEAAAIDMASGDLRRMIVRAERARDLAADVLPPLAGLASVLIGEAQLALGMSEEGEAALAAAEDALLAYTPGSGPVEIVAMAAQSSMWVERFDRSEALLGRLIPLLREAGLVAELPYPLAVRAALGLRRGRWPHALADATEAVELARDAGVETILAYALALLADAEAGLGRDDEARAHGEESIAMSASQGSSATAMYPHRALMLLALSRGRYEDALEHGLAAERAEARTDDGEAAISRFLPDLAEALWRTGDDAGAARRLEILENESGRIGHHWAGAVAARLRGLLGADEAVDEHFSEAARLHDAAGDPFEAARTALLHGERLRRARRPADARRPLSAALATFERLGAAAWTERAQGELRAAGGRATLSLAPAGVVEELTAQELQVALLAARGQTNREIGAGLFLSPKTVEHHLSRSFRKLGIRRRSELAGVLGSVEQAA